MPPDPPVFIWAAQRGQNCTFYAPLLASNAILFICTSIMFDAALFITITLPMLGQRVLYAIQLNATLSSEFLLDH